MLCKGTDELALLGSGTLLGLRGEVYGSGQRSFGFCTGLYALEAQHLDCFGFRDLLVSDSGAAWCRASSAYPKLLIPKRQSNTTPGLLTCSQRG